MAEPFVSVLVENILRELNSSVLQKSSFRVEINQIKGILLTMKPFLRDAENKQESNGAIRRWLEAATDAVYDLDDLVDTWQTSLAKVRISLFSSGAEQSIKQMMERLEYLAAEGVRFKLDDHPKELSADIIVAALPRSSVLNDVLIGKEEDKESIVKLLMESNVDDLVPIIPVVGTGGMGKTALARVVYHDERVARHFDVRAWLCASELLVERLVIKRIFESVVNYTIAFDDTHYDQLYRAMAGKKFLIVLDHVCENPLWLKSLITGIGGVRGSRVLMTTRDLSVGESLGTVRPFVLRGLDEEISWSLFKHVAFQQGQEPQDSGMVDVGKHIVKKSAGVPLVIKTIGSLLYFQNSQYEWLVFDRELAKITHDKEFDVLSILELCYHLLLPSHLKPCLSFFSLFQKDCRFDVNTLIKLWMAEGFIDPLDCSPMDDVGQGYVMELFRRSLFQEEEQDEWGSLSSFKLHDLVHDLAVLVASGKNKSVDSHVKDVHKTVRRVSLDFSSLYLEQFHTCIPEPHKLRTLLNSQSWLPFKDNSIMWNLSSIIEGLKSCKSLRILDLQNLGMEKVPSYVGDLVHLRYLDLSKNHMIGIPSSITRLLHLQTLKLSYCQSLKELPRGIGKMVNLRHLELEGCIDLQRMPSGLGQLISLQELSHFLLTKGCNPMSWRGSKLQELGKLNNLRGSLEILQLEHASVEDAEDARLKEKPLLRLLTLMWCRIDDDCEGIHKDDKVLEYLLPHLNLKVLCIRGYGGLGFPSWCLSLKNLVDFTFYNCTRCKCLLPLHLLPSLKNLKLLNLGSLEYISDGDVGDFMQKASIFPCLKKVTVIHCPNFRCWWKRNTFNDDVRSFHCLSNLEIRYCPQLASIPLYPTLDEELILLNVSAKLLQETMMMTTTAINMTAQEAPAKVEVPNSSSTFFFAPFPPALSKLKSLYIDGINDLETLPYEWLRNLTSLRSLKISGCENLKSLSHGIQHLSSLVCLKIEDCQELDLCVTEKDSMVWQFLKNLRSLCIRRLPKQKSLPLGLQYLTSLQFLHLHCCPSVIALPEWIGSLSSLNWMVISKCYNLASLPHGMCSLTSLHTLVIVDCPLLLSRCQPRTGEDWLKIANVPNFSLRPVFNVFW